MTKKNTKPETADEIVTSMEQRLAEAIAACQKIMRAESACLTIMASRLADGAGDDVRAFVESAVWKRACRVTSEAAVILHGLDLAERHYPSTAAK